MTKRFRKTLRIVTWNIHGFIGADRRFDPERTGRVVSRLDPDIIALQEVDSRRTLPEGQDGFHYLADVLGHHRLDAKTITSEDGEYGQMLLSRWPLKNSEVHDISVDPHEPRRIMETEAITPYGSIHILATHLGLNRKERGWQIDRIARMARHRGKRPGVLFGDFNAWVHRGYAHRLFSALYETTTWQRTFPVWYPLFALDRVWCSHAHLIMDTFVDKSAGRASDHLPLVADLSADALQRI